MSRAVTPPLQAGAEDEADDIDDASSEEEIVEDARRGMTRRRRLVFPKEDELWAGYIWGADAIFNVQVQNIRAVENPETNHRVLTGTRVMDMYRRLRGKDKELISPLTLRPIRYIVEGTGSHGESRRREVPFSEDNAVREFEAAYLHYAEAVSGHGVLGSRANWLENNIIWEPVDGQHIVQACMEAKIECDAGLLSEEEYREVFAVRKAKFVVYKDPHLYIDASVRINAKEFERQFYTTMVEDLMKLRAIWIACGRPDQYVRDDDERRGRALMMAASALHLTTSMKDNKVGLATLSKQMVDHTRHAWHRDEECYEAVLQVCSDYESGFLWFSKEDEKKWRDYASKHSLDVTVDVRAGRKRMEKNWLRPLSRIPARQYLRVAKDLAAQPVQGGSRATQKYYFNGNNSPNPPKETLAWVADRMQRREAVRNALRWLIVKDRERPVPTMEEFFVIPVGRYGGDRGEVLQELGENIETDMKKAWASPLVRAVGALEKLDPLIPPLIRQHYTDIATGGRGYRGHARDVGDLGAARWDWQFRLPIRRGGHALRMLPVRGRGGFFTEEHLELGEPCLWIIDCRRGSSQGEDKAWGDDDYAHVMERLQRWMTGIYKWNVIFLLPPGVHFEERLRNTLHVPEESRCFGGVWVFESGAISGYEHDLRHEGRVERAVQAIGGVAVVLAHASGSRASQNVRKGTGELPTVFMDSWTEARAPCTADPLERSPTELQRLVQMYLPEKWGLVVVGITTAIPDILQGDFVGSQIIVLDSSSTRTTFLRNACAEMYGCDMDWPSGAATQPWATAGPSTVRPTRGSTGLMDGVDSGACEGSEGEPSAIQRSADTVRHVEVSLGSRDTPDRERTHEDTARSVRQDDSITGLSPRYEVVAALSPQPVVGVESSAHIVYSSEGQDATGASGARGDALQFLEVDGTMEEGGTMETGDLSIRPEEVAEILAKSLGHEVTFSRSAGVSTSPLRPSGAIPVPDSLVSRDMEVLPRSGLDAGGSEVLPTPGVVVDIDSTPRPFHWALPDRDMTLAADGFYYDVDGVRYRRHGIGGQYTFEQAASIMEEASPVHQVSSPMVNAMVAQALEYTDPETPSDVRARLEEQRVASEEGRDDGTQSSERIPETQFPFE